MSDNVVATIKLEVMRDPDRYSKPLWIADGKHRGATAAEALERCGRELDSLLGQVPGFRWGEDMAP